MRNRKRMALILAPVLAAAVMVAATLRAQQGSPQNAEQQSRTRQLYEHLDKFPVADYDAPEDADPDRRAKRLNKGRKYNEPRRHKYDAANPVVGGGHNEWEWGLESTLPVKQSSAVVVGTVTGAKAFLSEDKTNIYSEYSVRVESVIKDSGEEPIKAGDTLAAERQGGRVRLPSGATSGFFISGQNPAQAGRRYVFFLGYNKYDASNLGTTSARDMSRHLLTAYELRGGKVEALDDPGGMNFKEHNGKGEAAFLDEIRRLLVEPSSAQPEAEGGAR